MIKASDRKMYLDLKVKVKYKAQVKISYGMTSEYSFAFICMPDKSQMSLSQ